MRSGAAPCLLVAVQRPTRTLYELRGYGQNPLPLHPGKVLAEVYMAEMGLNQTGPGQALRVLSSQGQEIVNGKRGISPTFAIVLESVLGTSAEMWVRMQAEHDLWEAR